MGLPTLPTALVFSPAAVNIDSSMPTVVVLPLVPVTASQGTCRSGRLIRQASSTSPHTGMPRSAAWASSGADGRQPGEVTTRSTSSGSWVVAPGPRRTSTSSISRTVAFSLFPAVSASSSTST